MNEYLVLTAVGDDRPGLVADLTEAISERGANIADSRMAVLGGEFALIMLVSGPAATLEGIRADVGAVAERLGLQLLVRETGSPAEHRGGRVRSYSVRVHALDHPGIVHAVSNAVRELGGNVVSLDTAAYEAAITGTPLFRMQVAADFPAEVTAARLRQALGAVSDAANADIEVEPV